MNELIYAMAWLIGLELAEARQKLQQKEKNF